MNFSIVKITLNDNSIMMTHDNLKSFMISNRWDIAKIFDNSVSAERYAKNFIVNTIMKFLDSSYTITEADVENEHFIHIVDNKKAFNLIDIRISHNESFTEASYFVTYTDIGETCDMHSRLLGGRFWTFNDAKKAVISEMNDLKDTVGYKYIDESKLEIWKDESEIGTKGCIYSILKF